MLFMAQKEQYLQKGKEKAQFIRNYFQISCKQNWSCKIELKLKIMSFTIWDGEINIRLLV